MPGGTGSSPAGAGTSSAAAPFRVPDLRAGVGGIVTRESSYHYEEIHQIGTGAYGTVWKARDLHNPGKFVALKKVRVPLTEDGVPMSTLREIGLLRQIDQHHHPNIVSLLDICHGPRLEKEHQLTLFLVFEHVDQDLSAYLERQTMTPVKVRDLMFQILCGVDFLHSHRIVHRDLKPQNILVADDGRVKLADFGLAKTYDLDMCLTSVVVTLWYRAPEVLLALPYATPVDVWACGCIMAELFRRTPLFCGSSEANQLERIFHVIGTPSEEEWPESVSIAHSSFNRKPGIDLSSLVPQMCPDAKHLLQQMLVFNPQRRICAADALEDPYFATHGLAPPEAQVAAGVTAGPLSPSSAALFLPADDAAPSAAGPDL
ncbi:cyclin-dependent kinase 4 [Neocloeon triangulifer]|uniref:cyclin-dependent kinase 4 n=1 Tax=Neocloeon triangulifer TaxID=2078957 RepID=UPI00286F2E3D|nr:cyclin-dependent kinase 4 [Neocloeon triangulifer]XP_059475846.1 cyclin-dependent kinase 4 [Neocloeon triangulifer]